MSDPTGVREIRFAERPVWLLEGTRAEHEARWRELDAAYDGSGPCGVVSLLAEPDPDAEWPDPRTVFAGYAHDGRQVRVAYFSAAVTRPVTGWPPTEPVPYRVVPFATQRDVGPDDLVAMWLREGALKEADARTRVDQVLLVAVDDVGAPVGVSTRYLDHHAQTGMDLWHVRVFVTEAHRRSAMATALAVGARDHLAEGFTSGRDTRGAGMVFDVVNAGLLRSLTAPVWHATRVVLIGRYQGGEELRVFYFPGAQVPQGSAKEVATVWPAGSPTSGNRWGSTATSNTS